MIAPDPTLPGALAPAIILVEPQLGENIGAAARAMANFGLTDLRLVKPRDGWPNERARRSASRADHVIERVRVFDTVGEAIGDLKMLLATTARPRSIARPVLGPAEAAARLRSAAAEGVAGGILFGRERTGLSNEELGLAEALLTLPVDPRFASLNVAQAVLITAYEWRCAEDARERAALPFSGSLKPPADKAELLSLFEHLEGALDAVGFFRPAEKRHGMVLGLRALLGRAQLSGQEVKTLRGVVAALERRPTRPHKSNDGMTSTEREGVLPERIETDVGRRS